MPPIIPIDTTNLVVIIALPEEHDVFLREFPSVEDVSTETHVRLKHKFGVDGFTLTSVLAEGMGADHAASAANSAIRDLNPDLLICLGIAGSLSSDAQLGDVCVASEVMDVLHNAKVVDGAGQKRTRSITQLSPRIYGVTTKLLACCRFLRSHPNQKEIYSDLKANMNTRWNQFTEKYPGNQTLKLDREAVNDFHVGPIVCGAVSMSKSYNAKLKDLNRKILAIETESGGIYKAAQDADIPAFTIRGISDKADRGKASLESSFAGALRCLAMQNATAFFKALCRNVVFLNTALLHANLRRGGRARPVRETQPEQILRKAEERIQAHLAAASAEFKHRPIDAPLPLPRVRRVATTEEVSGELDEQASSISDAILEERRIFLKIPRSYPERNVAWYIGLSLLKSEIDGKQVLPFVFDGGRIVPPSSGLRSILGSSFLTEVTNQSFAPVIVVSEPDFDSKTKTTYLASELNKMGSIPMIVVSKSETPVEVIDEFRTEVRLADYFTTSMPLAEMAGYLEQAFEMTPEEADVVAVRLDDTFSKFRLHTHPAYFIGLQESTLDALIDANQRAELIEIAVDGILSYVVANDKSKVKLSRTTREEFLSELAYEIRVEKRSFTKATLAVFAEGFSNRKNLELDSLEFLRGFFDFGLINDVANRVEFSLPFLEAFLLSERLMKVEADAARYFDPSLDFFDQYSFDLYCERGAGKSVIDKIVSFAEGSLQPCDNEPNILEGREIRPNALQNKNTLVSMASQMGVASEKIAAEPSSQGIRKEKQRLIDARDAVRAKIGHERRALSDHLTEDAKAEFAMLDALSRASSLLATLLGSGAERLEGDQKSVIADLLLRTTERFLHHWTKNRARVDFKGLRQELLSPESVRSVIEQFDLFEDSEQDVRESLSLFIDDHEVKLLSGPLGTILHRLSTYAGVRSLRPVVAEADPNCTAAAILRASWMMDVEPRSGKSLLKKAFRNFKGSSLVRLTLADHFMWRIFWHHWRMASRTLFLEGAKLALKPLGIVAAPAHTQKMLRKDNDE